MFLNAQCTTRSAMVPSSASAGSPGPVRRFRIGRALRLTGADTATPSFTAPDAAGEVVLSLTVTTRHEFCKESDTVTVTVTVKDACADSFNGALRLAGENRQDGDEGRLEICYDDGDSDTTDGDGWGAVCDDYWTDVEADVACRQLGYERTCERRDVAGRRGAHRAPHIQRGG